MLSGGSYASPPRGGSGHSTKVRRLDPKVTRPRELDWLPQPFCSVSINVEGKLSALGNYYNWSLLHLVTNLALSTTTWRRYNCYFHFTAGFPGGSLVKNPPLMQEMWVQSLVKSGRSQKEMAIHSSILAWEIPWTEEPGGLQSMGSQRVKHDLATKEQQCYISLLTAQIAFVVKSGLTHLCIPSIKIVLHTHVK